LRTRVRILTEHDTSTIGGSPLSSDNEFLAAAAAAAAAAVVVRPGAEFELIEAAPQQRFKRIVLRETCLMDHRE
jgi:hypothetical protein